MDNFEISNVMWNIWWCIRVKEKLNQKVWRSH